MHYGSVFHYVPNDDVAKNEFITGRIGRRYLVPENEPPEAGFAEVERPAWKAGEIVIDPRPHSDGQKAAIEIAREMQKPIAVLRSLASAVNKRAPSQPYVLEPNPIVDPATFWRFVEENEGQIKRVSFEMYPPNMFGIRDNLDRELRELKENEKAMKVDLTLESDDGLHLLTDRTKQTAKYTTEGGGNISALTKSNKRFSTKNQARVIIIEENLGKKSSIIERIWEAMRNEHPD